MAQTLYRWLAIAVLAFPATALANLSQSTILQANTSLNLTTGAVAGSGGDILWDGSVIKPQGSAKARNLDSLGATSFNALTESYFESVAKRGSSAPIAAALLRPGDVFVAVANGGQTAKVLVLANSASISLQFTTFGVSGVAGVPSVVKVLNNSSAIEFGFPNYGIAPSSLFLVVGSGLADPGTPVL